MSKLNGLGKTHRERIFVLEHKLKLCSLFHFEQIAWENSGIKWMKVLSFSLTVTIIIIIIIIIIFNTYIALFL